MKAMKKRLYQLMPLALILGCQPSLAMQASTTSFTVQSTVVAACTISAGALIFGNYNANSNAPLTSENTITVTCSPSTSYSIGLDQGVGTKATVSNRLMTLVSGSSTAGGTNALTYNIYQDSLYQTIWGNVTPNLVTGTGDGEPHNYTAYGRIPTGQVAVQPGSYQDTINVAVSF